MAYLLSNNCTANYRNQTAVAKDIVEGWVVYSVQKQWGLWGLTGRRRRLSADSRSTSASTRRSRYAAAQSPPCPLCSSSTPCSPRPSTPAHDQAAHRCGLLLTHCEGYKKHPVGVLSYSVGGSSDAALRCQHCSNLL